MSSPENLPVQKTEVDEKLLLPLVVILGPSAVGKTEIALELAERFNGEIISADSRLFYRGMDIGTAKPSVQDRKRVKHHLIDVAAPDETWSLALFQHAAQQAIQGSYSRQHLPFLVGGTGQFVRSILEGWKIPPAHPDPRLRQVLEQWASQLGTAELHRKLSLLDPKAASVIDPSNARRTMRALEVILTTGKRFSDQRTSGDKRYETLQLGLMRPRPELYQRVDERITSMIESGFIDEVRWLLEAGYSPELPTMSAIGYGEIIAYLQGKITLDEAIRLMKRRTRIFIRRQANWFKENDPDIRWFRVGKNTRTELEGLIIEWLRSINQTILIPKIPEA
jgi:tRNA dimethylallyltransferase